MWYLKVKSMEAFFLCVSSALCLCAERSAALLPTWHCRKERLCYFFSFSYFLLWFHGIFLLGLLTLYKSFWACGLPLGWASTYNTLQWEGKEVVVITHCALESFQTLSGYQSWSWRELAGGISFTWSLSSGKDWSKICGRFQLGLSSSVHWLILLLVT